MSPAKETPYNPDECYNVGPYVPRSDGSMPKREEAIYVSQMLIAIVSVSKRNCKSGV